MHGPALLTVFVFLQWPGAFGQPILPRSGTDSRTYRTSQLPAAHEEGDIKAVDFTVNTISLVKSRYPTLRGQGIRICLKEQAPDADDVDLRGRLVASPVSSAVITSHATQMATILLGAGNSSPLNEGIAPKATLIPASFNNLLPESDAFYRTNHVTVVNHSYGTAIENFYGPEAVAYDESVNQISTLLHVFSAGNLGYSSSSTGIYANLPTLSTLTGNAKMAKNNLVVGDIGSDGLLQPSSSRGPAYDGRIKPELVAYSDEGSSGAAALVSGVTALLQQALYQQTNTDASAALIKTVLINSANDVGNKGPDYQTGYGSLNAFQALETIREKRYAEATVPTNGTFELTIQVPAARRLRITLAWTDLPAILNSKKALVNDLDLTVSDGHSIWLPWVLNASPNLDSLRKEPIRTRDTLNNVEQITLDMPSPGQYTIRVTSARIDGNTQPFAVAYQWDTPNTFYWTAPVAGVPTIGDTTTTVRWKNTTSAVYGILEYSSDQGKSWTKVLDRVALEPGALSWKIPDALTTGQLRMRVADSVYVSDRFVVSPLPTLNLLYACGDSLGIAWSTEVGRQPVLLHTLYKLAEGADTWVQVGPLIGNQAVIKRVLPGDLWAITPVSPAGVVGIRSEAVSGKQVACYYRTLTADVVNNGANIQCELSTTEGVSTVTFQKQTTQGAIQYLSTQSVTDQRLVYSLTDSLLQEGPNTYRVRIGLNNGTIVYSDFAIAYAIRTKPFLLYPNPVSSGQMLTIRSGEPGLYMLHLVDVMGRIIQNWPLSGTVGEVSTAGLSTGIYFYAIYGDGPYVQTGKLFIR